LKDFYKSYSTTIPSIAMCSGKITKFPNLKNKSFASTNVHGCLAEITYRHVRELETLYRISHILAAGKNKKQALAEVLDMLDCELGMNRGTVTLLGSWLGGRLIFHLTYRSVLLN